MFHPKVVEKITKRISFSTTNFYYSQNLAVCETTVKNTVEQWRTQEFCSGGGGGVSTNSVEDREQRERGSRGGTPLVGEFWKQL